MIVWPVRPHDKFLHKIAETYLRYVVTEGDAEEAEYARRFIDPAYATEIGRIVRALEA